MTAKEDLLAELRAAYVKEKSFRAQREYELQMQLKDEMDEVITITNYLLAKGEALEVSKSAMAEAMGASRSTIYARLLHAPVVELDAVTEEKVEVEKAGFKYLPHVFGDTITRVEVEYHEFGPEKLTGFAVVMPIGIGDEEAFLVAEGDTNEITARLEADNFYSKHLIKWVTDHA